MSGGKHTPTTHFGTCYDLRRNPEAPSKVKVYDCTSNILKRIEPPTFFCPEICVKKFAIGNFKECDEN